MSDVESMYLRHLRAVLPVARIEAQSGTDSEVDYRIETPKGVWLFQAKRAQAQPTLARLRRLLASTERNALLLMLPHVGPTAGARLADMGANYIDQQGNCHLVLGDEHYVHVEGRAAPKKPAGEKIIRAAGYRVLFALLAREALLNVPLRTAATQADVSTRAVADMRERLIEMGYLVLRKGTRHWVEHRLPDLCDLWFRGYRATLRPSLLLGRYELTTAPDGDPIEAQERLVRSALSDLEWRWGGATAAYHIDGHYRSPVTTAHLMAPPPPGLRANPTREPAIEFLRPPAKLGLNGATDDTAHPLLIWAECQCSPDERTREAGVELLARLAPKLGPE